MNYAKNQPGNFEANPMIEDALKFSEDFTRRYLQERVSIDNGMNESDVMHLACARLQWVLDRTRLEVSGIFSEDEFMMLSDCNMDRFFSPDSFTAIPSMLCDHYGIELDDYEATHLKVLVNKLRDLDGMQFLALGDAMEQSWHRGLKSGKTVREFLLTLGIELA